MLINTRRHNKAECDSLNIDHHPIAVAVSKDYIDALWYKTGTVLHLQFPQAGVKYVSPRLPET